MIIGFLTKQTSPKFSLDAENRVKRAIKAIRKPLPINAKERKYRTGWASLVFISLKVS